ncbi:MAG: NAD-dependent epimerase/dehydratase family protein [Polyangiaceae bacterium]
MKIVVTGAAGFIGSHLSESLARAGHEVVGIDAFTDFYDVRLKEENAAAAESAGAKVHRLDLATDDLVAAVSGAGAVFHLAAQPGLSARTTFDHYVKNNILATHALMAALDRAGAKPRFVNIATSSVYGVQATGDEATVPTPTSVYGVTKLAAEQLVLARQREGTLDACSLRIFSVYGPRERPDKFYARLIRSILEGTEIPLHEGSEHHTRSFSFIGDIVRGLLAVFDQWETARGEIFNIGTDVESTTGEGLALVEKLTGRKAKIVNVPKRAGDQLRTCANIGKARRLLGYAPQTSLEEGLRAEIEWFRKKLGTAAS